MSKFKEFLHEDKPSEINESYTNSQSYKKVDSMLYELEKLLDAKGSLVKSISKEIDGADETLDEMLDHVGEMISLWRELED